MALIPIYHVVADYFSVDPDWTTPIVEGHVVRLTGDGDQSFVNLATTTSSIGINADTLSNTTAGTPYAANLVIGAYGPIQNPTAKTRSTENRVSDMFNETLASGEMTVYHAGGKFASDIYETIDTSDAPITYAVGDPLYSSANGKLTNENFGSAARRIGQCVLVPQEYPSGVPGTATPDGSTSLGVYLTFILEI
jgi:hypothetical protein